MGLCPHCMRPASGEICPHCGRLMAVQENGQILPVGTVLTSNGGWHNYQVGTALGQGGFGVTYIGLLLETGQRVAIKEYFPSHCSQRDQDHNVVARPGKEKDYEKGLSGYLREAKFLAGLRPLPSVVKALDFFPANGTAYLAMEYLEGTPLSKVVEKNGPIPAQSLLPRMQPLMRDMEAMHQYGLIHRDVAPDNIMQMADGSLRLIDFGSARSTQAKEMTVMLKPRFAPVEQYQETGQGPWTDVYSMAATIYYCLTGIVPPDIFDRLEDPDSVRPPRELGVDLTGRQEAALMWAMAVQPKDRPQSMQEFSQELFADSAKRSSAGGPQKKISLPRPLIYALAALLVLLLIVLLLGLTGCGPQRLAGTVPAGEAVAFPEIVCYDGI